LARNNTAPVRPIEPDIAKGGNAGKERSLRVFALVKEPARGRPGTG